MELNWPSCRVISCIQIDWSTRWHFSKDNSMFFIQVSFFAKSVVFLTFDEMPHPRRVNVHQLVRSAENVLQDEKIK